MEHPIVIRVHNEPPAAGGAQMPGRQSGGSHEEELIFACGAIALSIGAANAGPCKHYRAGRWLRTDLGLYRSDHRHSSAKTPAHLPTDTMNGVAGDKAMPSQDAHAQQQGQPTASQ
jgi:hypothetical protein